MLINNAGTFKVCKACIRSGKGVVAVSKIAICTDNQLRIRMLKKRMMPASETVNVHEPIVPVHTGCPGNVNMIVMAAKVKGKTIKASFSMYIRGMPPNPAIATAPIHAVTNASQAPSGNNSVDTINKIVTTVLTRGSS